ncbi:MAG TPA: acetate--CoA ligase [Baekduia sp.]|nr:acetate--CoA ligase [Baekduia sp.]
MAATATDRLEERLSALLRRDRVEVPADFARASTLTDRPFRADDPLAYWAGEAGRLDWLRRPTEVLDDSRAPFYRWFADGTVNASYECLDRHVAAGLGPRVALHWEGEDGSRRDVTYAELLDHVQRLANVLLDRGVRAGDVVGIHLPMVPEVVVAMLACARIGAPHNVVFGGFSAGSVAERLEASEAVALITADGARRKGRTAPVKGPLDELLAPLEHLHTVVVLRHTGVDCPMDPVRDVDYAAAVHAAAAVCPPAELEAEHPLFLLYSSGSTAKPKGIVHSTGGYLVGVTSTQRLVFDVDPDRDVWFCTADVGWITGHSYMVYGPLANAMTSVMYEGAPDFPHHGIWWELVERHRATHFYTAPTAIRACMRWGAEVPARHDLSSLRLLGTVGEPINPKAWHWYREVIGGGTCPVVDTWWQTETGCIMVTTLPGAQAMKPGSAGTPLPGVRAGLRDDNVFVLEHPWPSMLRGLHGDDDRYVETYWSRYDAGTYLVGDAAEIDDDGYVWIKGRIDDVINVSGHRLSTAEVESALVAHEAVAEAAVVAQSDELTGQAILAFVTATAGRDTAGLEEELREHVAQRIGKLARPKRIVLTDDLPKTRSGKIMRRLLRDLGEGRELGDTSTLRDPAIVRELASRLQEG